MKGIVLALFSFAIGVVSSFGADPDTQFGVGTSQTSATKPALMIRTPVKTSDALAQLVTDNRSETRGSRPSVAYTVFRFDSKAAEVSLQPVFGRINGAQIFLSF